MPGSMLRNIISERHQFLIVKSNLNLVAIRTVQTVNHRIRAGTFWSRHTGDFENFVAMFLFVALLERGVDV